MSNADLRGASWTKVKIDCTTKISPKWRLVWDIVNHGVQGGNLSGTVSTFPKGLGIFDGSNLIALVQNLTIADATRLRSAFTLV